MASLQTLIDNIGRARRLVLGDPGSVAQPGFHFGGVKALEAGPYKRRAGL